MAQYEPWNAERARSVIAVCLPAAPDAQHETPPEGLRTTCEPASTFLLPILHALQATFGCVPVDAEPLIADRLNLSRADVHGVVSFYHEFRRMPPGRHVLRLCRAEACQSVAGETVAETVRTTSGIDWHETTPDGRLTLEPVFCLGLCASGPAALLDGAPVGRLTPQRARALLESLA